MTISSALSFNEYMDFARFLLWHIPAKVSNQTMQILWCHKCFHLTFQFYYFYRKTPLDLLAKACGFLNKFCWLRYMKILKHSFIITFSVNIVLRLMWNFRKGRHAPRFQKVGKTFGKEKWHNPFSVLPLWKHVVEK